MPYFFECETCKKKEYFNTYDNPYIAPTMKAEKQEYETVLCTSCVSRRVRLQGNHIIIK